MTEGVEKGMNNWTGDWTNDELMSLCFKIIGYKDGWLSKWWMNEQRNFFTGVCKYIGRQMSGWKEGWMNGCLGRWVGKWMRRKTLMHNSQRSIYLNQIKTKQPLHQDRTNHFPMTSTVHILEYRKRKRKKNLSECNMSTKQTVQTSKSIIFYCTYLSVKNQQPYKKEKEKKKCKILAPNFKAYKLPHTWSKTSHWLHIVTQRMQAQDMRLVKGMRKAKESYSSFYQLHTSD